MIYPTARAVVLVAAGAPAVLVLAVAAPGLWVAALAWIPLALLVMALDAWLAPAGRSSAFEFEAPRSLAAVSGPEPARLIVRFDDRAPKRIEAALEVNGLLALSPGRRRAEVQDKVARLEFALLPLRRGQGQVMRAWARWTGPLGLVHLQASRPLDRGVPVLPNVREAREELSRLTTKDAFFGLKAQIELGDGSEFHALREFQPGMDLRAVDWKQSARHGALLSREFRSERNHPVMLVVDSGRTMGEPVGGAPRLDRALNAALAMAYIGLKVGDRIGLAAFDSKPRLISRTAAGPAAFPTIQALAARIDYSTEETNFTLGLSAVSGALDRRALIIVFTEFADATSAELMLQAASRLLKRHLLLFVLFEDEELQALTHAAPEVPADVSRAVVADALLRERELVIARLRRMGAEVVQAPADQVSAALIDRYLALKRRDRL